MIPAGFIGTFMSLRDWRQWWFNLPLLVFQLIFLIVGTAYGKIKWEKASIGLRLYCAIFGAVAFVGLVAAIIAGWFSLMIFNFWGSLFWIATYRGIDWYRVWQAAKCSHVRLVLERAPQSWLTANFGYPKMEIQPWHIRWNDGKRFRYFEPTFEPSDEFIAAMIEYAEAQVGKGYDDLQLISSGLHIIAWIIWPWCWGKELRIIKALNRKGGREHCTSGFTACLRWAEAHSNNMLFKTFFDTDYFPGYDTAVIPPCLAPLSKNWEER